MRIAIIILMFAGVCVRPARAAADTHRFRHDYILGTSLDLTIAADTREQALAAHKTVLAEVERLRKIFSVYDPTSELSRLNRSTGPVKCSPELLGVLAACEVRRVKTGGAFSCGTGELSRLWANAQKTGRAPTARALRRASRRALGRVVEIDETRGTVTRVRNASITLDAAAKGFIIDKAVIAARASSRGVRGVLLDIGGDIMAWGVSAPGSIAPWRVGVADPMRSEDNAAPLVVLRLRNQGMATSGSYARQFVVAGKRYSNILDPRTGRPVAEVVSATVVARSTHAADALATTLCVLGVEKGLEFANALEGVECLLITAAGKQHASTGWHRLVVPESVATGAGSTTDPSGWPAGYQMKLTIVLSRPRAKKYLRPYMAVWIEDAGGTPIRILSVWSKRKKRKYLKDLRVFWRFARKDRDTYEAVSRATRGPGRYRLVWNGLDDQGHAVPRGKYIVHVEVAREKGTHQHLSAAVTCGSVPVRKQMGRNIEINGVTLTYGPAGVK